MRPSLFALIACGLFATAFGPATARAQSVGDRAVGMGGAYTALADDLSALWYNPAGLVQTAPRMFSASASAYQVRADRVDAAIVFHERRALSVKPLKASSINVFPSTLLYGARWGDKGTRHALAAGLLLPVSDRSFGQVGMSNVNGGFQRSFQSTRRVQEWYVGPAYAIGTRTLSLGISALLRLYDREYDYDLFQEVQVPGRFHSVAARVYSETYRHLSFLPAVGVQWAPTQMLRLGLMATAPGTSLWGSAKVTRVVTLAGPLKLDGQEKRFQEQETAHPNTVQPTPLRLTAGAALVREGSWAVALTAEHSGSLDAEFDRDEPMAHSTELEHDLLLRDSAIDLRLGGEFSVGDGWTFRAGAYTQGQHRPPFPTGRSDASGAGDLHSDSVGLNVALGVDGDGGRSSSYGLNFVRGQGEALAFHAAPPGDPDNPAKSGDPLNDTWAEPTLYSWWSVTFVVSGTVESD